jgi:hypothetical protein
MQMPVGQFLFFLVRKPLNSNKVFLEKPQNTIKSSHVLTDDCMTYQHILR